MGKTINPNVAMTWEEYTSMDHPKVVCPTDRMESVDYGSDRSDIKGIYMVNIDDSETVYVRAHDSYEAKDKAAQYWFDETGWKAEELHSHQLCKKDGLDWKVRDKELYIIA